MVLGGALGPGFVAGAPRHFAWQAWHNLTSTFVSRGRRGTISHLPSFCVAGVPLMVLGGALGPGFVAGAPRHFAWQAWHNLTSTFVSRGRRGTISHLPSFCVAGVALMVLGGALGPGFVAGAPRHFAWQAWHNLTSTLISRGRRGTNSHLPSFCVTGVPYIYRRFAWQAWHKLTSTVVLRGRRGAYGAGWRPWAGICRRGAAPLCVAGVSQPDIHLRFTWQAWHNLTSTAVLRGRRGTYTGWRPWAGICRRGAAPLCVAGVAQPDIHLRFTWQAWHNLTSTVVLRGRRGTYGTGWRPWAGICRRGAPPLCVAGVAQPDIHLRFTWQAWHNLTSTVVLRGRRGTYGTGWRPWAGICRRGAAPLCVAGVAQPDIHLRFTWQAWHNLTSTVVLRGRRGTYGTGWRPWAGICRLGAAPLCVAGVAQPDIHLDITWQAWHKLTSTVVLRGRRATYGTGWRPWAGICRRGAAPLCVAGMAQPDIHLRFTWQAWHNLTSTVVLRGRRGTHGFSGLFTHVMCRHVFGRSGMLSFPTCFRLRLVCSTGLFAHVMFQHV